MKQTFETTKSVQETVDTITENAANYKFGVLHVHNVKNTLNSKGFDFDNECQIMDVCNPAIAQQFLTEDMSLSCIMPCKIAVYIDKGETKVVINSLVQLVDDINPDMTDLAQEAQEKLIQIIEESI